MRRASRAAPRPRGERDLGADLGLVGATIVWGSSFIATKDALTAVEPLVFLAVRFGLGALIFALVVLRVRPTRFEIVWGTILGALLWAGNIAQTVGLLTVTPSRSAFLTSLSVVLVPALTVLLWRRIPPLAIWGAVLLAVAGLVALYWTEAGLSLRTGDVLTLACAALFAGHIMALGATGGRARSLPLCAIQLAVAAAGFWALVPFRSPLAASRLATPSTPFAAQVASLPGHAWGSILYLATIGTVVPFALQTTFQPRTTPSRAAVIFTLEPLFASGFAALLAGARFTVRDVAGSVLIHTGALIAALGPATERRPAA